MIKRLWFILTVAGWLFSLAALCQKPIAHYTFNNSANDFSGNRNNGVIYGNVFPTMDRFGDPCGAYHFDGVNAYIEVPTSPSLESPVKAFTVAVWYRFDTKKDNYWLTAVCKGFTNKESFENPQYRLQVQQNTANVINSCSAGIAQGSSTVSISTGFTVCDQDFQNHLFQPHTWSFYALVFDGKMVTAYMNAVKVFESNYAASFIANQSSLFIGLDEPGVTEHFEGSLDDLSLFDKALTSHEIEALYKESRKADWSKEEFTMSMLENKVVTLQKNGCEVMVDFDVPNITAGKCGNVSVHQVSGLPSGSGFKVGKHLVTFEAKELSGYEQRCSFYIIVQDLIPPDIFVPGDTVIYVKKGANGIKYFYKQPYATDNCGIKALTLISGIESNGFFAVKRHVIRYRATDVNGNNTEKEFAVDVQEEKNIVTFPPKTPAPPVDMVKRDSPSIKPAKPVLNDSLPMPDSLSVPITVNPFTRKNQEQKYLEVSSPVLKAVLYDNGIYDGDTVSIFLNKKVLLYKQELNVAGKSFTIPLDFSIDNELMIYAENLGSMPPNTALLVVYDGNLRFEVNLSSTLKTNGTIRIRKKK